MADAAGSFIYDENFNYIGERWTAIDQSGTKGYEPSYEGLFRLPDLGPMGSIVWDVAQPLNDHLRRADRLLILAGRVTSERGYDRRTDLVHNFLLRGTRAIEWFLQLLSAGDVMNAWAIARVLIERCIWLGYILKTGTVDEFYEYSALKMKKWAYEAASMGVLDRESVEDWDEEMEDELGHRLGRPAPLWDELGIKGMCRVAFDQPQSDRIYNLYQLASMSTHPGMDDCGEYFVVTQVVYRGPGGGTGDSGPLKEMIQISAGVFNTLVALAEGPLTEVAGKVFVEEAISIFLTLRTEPTELDHELLTRGLRLSPTDDEAS